MVQVVRGVILSLRYRVGRVGGYRRVVGIIMDLEGGWVVRLIHRSGARVMFLFMYLHIIRGIVYRGVKMRVVWVSGVVVLMVCMGVSFLGYVLP